MRATGLRYTSKFLFVHTRVVGHGFRYVAVSVLCGEGDGNYVLAYDVKGIQCFAPAVVFFELNVVFDGEVVKRVATFLRAAYAVEADISHAVTVTVLGKGESLGKIGNGSVFSFLRIIAREIPCSVKVAP